MDGGGYLSIHYGIAFHLEKKGAKDERERENQVTNFRTGNR